jgi:hypothetical protein
MRIASRIYIGSILVVGAAILAGSAVMDPHLPDAARFLQFLVLAIVASTFKIRLPGMQGNISLNFVVFLIGIRSLTLTETVLLASIATLVQAFWRPKTRPAMVKVLFNISVLAIGVTCAYLASQQMRETETQVPALVVAATVLFVLNSWLVSFVIALTSGESALSVWRNCNRWVFMYYLMGAAVAVLVIACSRTAGWVQSLAMLPAAYLVYAYVDGYVGKARQAQV